MVNGARPGSGRRRRYCTDTTYDRSRDSIRRLKVLNVDVLDAGIIKLMGPTPRRTFSHGRRALGRSEAGKLADITSSSTATRSTCYWNMLKTKIGAEGRQKCRRQTDGQNDQSDTVFAEEGRKTAAARARTVLIVDEHRSTRAVLGDRAAGGGWKAMMAAERRGSARRAPVAGQPASCCSSWLSADHPGNRLCARSPMRRTSLSSDCS